MSQISFPQTEISFEMPLIRSSPQNAPLVFFMCFKLEKVFLNNIYKYIIKENVKK